VKGFVRENPHAVENRTETSGRSARLGAVRDVARVIMRSSLSERRFSSRQEAEGLVHMLNGSGRPPWPLPGAAGLFFP